MYLQNFVILGALKAIASYSKLGHVKIKVTALEVVMCGNDHAMERGEILLYNKDGEVTLEGK